MWSISHAGGARRWDYECIEQKRRAQTSSPRIGIRRGRDRHPRKERARRRARPLARRRLRRHHVVPPPPSRQAQGPGAHHARGDGRCGHTHQLLPRSHLVVPPRREAERASGGEAPGLEGPDRPVRVVLRLPRRPRPSLGAAGGDDPRPRPRRGYEGLRGRGTRPRARARPAGGTRLDRQEHDAHRSGARVVHLHRRCADRRRPGAGSPLRWRPLRHLPPLPRRLPHPGLRRPGRAGRAPLHLVSHDRATRRVHRHRAGPGGRLAVRLRRLPGRVSLEREVRGPHGRPRARLAAVRHRRRG